MGKISIFNYEAFYLDFLEGNLNEVDTALFLEFLDANPELRMENEELPIFDKSEFVLSEKEKSELKQPLYTDPISDVTIDYFLIAQAEGLLNNSKSEELNQYIKGDKKLATDQRIFQAVFFEADQAVIYTNKAGLKRKKAIVLWPYYAAVAASVLFAMMMWNFGSDSITDKTVTPVFAKDLLNEEKTNTSSGSERNKKELAPIEDEERLIAHDNFEKKNEKSKVFADLKEEKKNQGNSEKPKSINKLKLQQVNTLQENNSPAILASIDNTQLKAITSSVPEDASSGANEDYASLYFGNAENPIEPITSFIGDKTNTVVDFRRQRKTKTQGKGFFVKVGTFEFSRTKHK